MDQYELAELRRAVSNRLGGFYNSFRYQANRALWILPHLSVGRLFSDTLGKFYPFNVNTNGDIVINSSANHKTALTFHDTGTNVTDLVDYVNNLTRFIVPNSGSSIALLVAILDRNVLSGANGIEVDPANRRLFFESNGGGGNAAITWDNTSLVTYAGILSGSAQINSTGISGTSGVKVTNQYWSPAVTDTVAATTTTDLNVGNVRILTLGANVTTWTIQNPQDGGRYIFIIAQDGTGGRTFAIPGSFKWIGGVTPTITATASHVDLISSVYHGGNFYSTIAQNYG